MQSCRPLQVLRANCRTQPVGPGLHFVSLAELNLQWKLGKKFVPPAEALHSTMRGSVYIRCHGVVLRNRLRHLPRRVGSRRCTSLARSQPGDPRNMLRKAKKIVFGHLGLAFEWFRTCSDFCFISRTSIVFPLMRLPPPPPLVCQGLLQQRVMQHGWQFVWKSNKHSPDTESRARNGWHQNYDIL